MIFKLKENLLLEDIAAVKKNYPKISDEDFDRIIRLDPTFQEGKDSVGTYGKWLLNLFNKGNLTNEGHVHDLLSRFEQEKKYLKNKDIGQFKTLEDVDAYLDDDDNYKDKSHRQEVRSRQKDRKNADLEKDAELVYQDSDWKVYIPKSYAASCKLGQGSTWCTASTESDHYYKYYTNQGPLYIVINKSDPNEKYQLHFESGSFMDIDDSSIDLVNGLLSDNEGLHDFFFPMICDYLGIDEEAQEDGHVTASIYDIDDYEEVFDDQGKFIYSLVQGNVTDFFDMDIDLSKDQLGYLPMTPKIETLFKEHNIDSYEQLFNENYAALNEAYNWGSIYGAFNIAYLDLVQSLNSSGAHINDEEIIVEMPIDTILMYIDELYGECTGAEDMAKMIFRMGFNLDEPRYGWQGFDEDVFSDVLSDNLQK